MSAIPASVRKVNTVIHLSLEVNEGIVSIHIQSIIPPFSQRRKSPCSGGVLQYRIGQEEIRYALICGRYTGKWGFPKGKREGEETTLQSALREIEEEVGIWQLGPPIGRFSAPGKQTYFVFEVNACLPLCPLDTLEICETGWMTEEEIRRLNTNLGVKAFLKWLENRRNPQERQNGKTEQKETEEKGE
jgi:hypothetical protein